jgi:O-antigen ligase
MPESAAPVAAPPFVFASATAPRWFGVLAIVLFALLMPVGYLGDEGEALIVAIGGAAALAFVVRKRPPSVGVLILAALTAWAVASFAWSPLEPQQLHPRTYSQLQALTAPKLVLQLVLYSAFVSGALKLAPDQRETALKWVSWTLAGVAAVLALDALAAGHIFGALSAAARQPLTDDLAKRNAARGTYATALIFWPMAIASWRRLPAAVPIVIGLVTAGSAVLLGVDAPAAALALSTLVFAAARVNWRVATWTCLAGTAVYFAAAPLIFLSRTGAPPVQLLPSDIGKMSWHIRLDIWRFASGLIAARPIQGYGLDASRAYEPAIPMHPHDAALQLWLELGVLGPALMALFFSWLFYKVLRLGAEDPSWAAASCACASVYLLIGAISFGVWQEWWLGLGAAAIATCGMVLQSRRDRGLKAADLGPDGLRPL